MSNKPAFMLSDVFCAMFRSVHNIGAGGVEETYYNTYTGSYNLDMMSMKRYNQYCKRRRPKLYLTLTPYLKSF